MAPSQRTEGASKPSNTRQGARFSLKPDDEKVLITEIINQVEQDIQAPRNHDESVLVGDIEYPDFALLIDEALTDEGVAEELIDLFRRGTLAIRHRDYLVQVLHAIERDWVAEANACHNQVLELQEALVTTKDTAAEWKMKYADAMLRRTTAIQVPEPEPEPSQSRPEVSSRPVRPVQPVRNDTTLQIDTSDNEDEPVAPQKKSKAKVRKPLTDPEMLSDGKNVIYEAWEIKMKDKLEWDHEEYRTEKEKVSFIFSRTTGKASEVLLPYLQPGPLRILTAKAAFETLSACFQDRHRKSKALAAFKKLHLCDGGDYHLFHMKFTILALASGISFDSYKEEFADRLPDGIRVHLLGPEQDDQVDFVEYQKLASQVAIGKALLHRQEI